MAIAQGIVLADMERPTRTGNVHCGWSPHIVRDVKLFPGSIVSLSAVVIGWLLGTIGTESKALLVSPGTRGEGISCISRASARDSGDIAAPGTADARLFDDCPENPGEGATMDGNLFKPPGGRARAGRRKIG